MSNKSRMIWQDSLVRKTNKYPAMMTGQPPLLRRLNEGAILEALRKHGPLSRAALARRLRLSKSTVSEIVTDLLRRGLVHEAARERPGPSGRTAMLLDITPEAGFVCGIDIGGTFARAAVADLKGRIRARLGEEVSRSSLTDLEEQVVSLAHRALAQAGIRPTRLLAAGIGVPGAVAPESGAVTLCPNLPFLEGVALADRLQPLLGCEVLVENDVNLGAIGEKWRGCAANVPNFAYMAVGTGVGMGVVLNGDLYRGARGFAGEVGYLPVPSDQGTRPLEHVIGGRAIAQRYVQLLHQSRGAEAGRRSSVDAGSELADPGSAMTARHVFDAARRGDPVAMTVVYQVAAAMAWAIASVTTTLDLSLVVIGGGVGQNADLLLEPVANQVASLVPFVPEIRVSALGGDANLYGAIAAALRVGRLRVELEEPEAEWAAAGAGGRVPDGPATVHPGAVPPPHPGH